VSDEERWMQTFTGRVFPLENFDPAEAYLGGVPTPLKKSMPEFECIEDELMKLIGDKFGFEWPEKETVGEMELKRADRQLLTDEKEVVMGREPKSWLGILEVKNSDRIQCWSPDEAKYTFLERFRELTT